MNEEYYTAKDAMQILRKPSTSFYREVREGRIPHTGKRPNMRFPKEAIDALADVGTNKEKDEKLLFTYSTIADAWTKQEVTRQPYSDEDAVPFRVVLEWRKKNDNISMHVEEKKKILGWTTFLPLDEKIIVDLIYNQIRERDISLQSVRRWTEEQLSIYIPIIEVLPSDNPERDKEVGAFLLRKTIRWAIMLMLQYDIKNWYGIGTTPEGQVLLEKLGFKTLVSLDEGRRKGYVLESKTEPVRLISSFLRSVEEQRG